MTSKRNIKMQDRILELVAGLFFVSAMIIVGTFTIILQKDFFWSQKDTVSIEFPHVGTLQKGNKVLLRGLEVGYVDKMHLKQDENKIVVEITLLEEIQFYSDYFVEIRESSILGGRYIYIEAGTLNNEKIGSEFVLIGNPPIDTINEAGRLIQEFQKDQEYVKEAIEKEGLVVKFVEIVNNIRDITDTIKNKQGTLSKLIYDDSIHSQTIKTLNRLSTISDTIDHRIKAVEDAGKSLRAAGESIYRTSENINNSIVELNNGSGTLGKLITDDDLYNSLDKGIKNITKLTNEISSGNSTMGRFLNDNGKLYTEITESFESIDSLTREGQLLLKKINIGEGTVGKLITDDTLYTELKTTIDQIQGTITDIREQLPIATFGSFIFGAL